MSRRPDQTNGKLTKVQILSCILFRAKFLEGRLAKYEPWFMDKM